MIGVAQNDLGPEVQEVARCEGLDRAARANRHECRRLNHAVRRHQFAAAGGAVPIENAELKGIGHRYLRIDYPLHVKRLRVGVLYGGRSGEHEVSLASAAAVWANLDRTKYEPITLERGITHDLDFETWANAAQVLEKGVARQSLSALRRTVRIVLQNEAGQPVQEYNVHRCWVSEYQALPDLDAGGNAVAIEHIKLENEGWERLPSVGEPDESKSA